MRRVTAKQEERLRAVAAIPDDQIDTSDIPEIKDFNGGIRGRFAKPRSTAISLRISDDDLGRARTIADKKGLPYQTLL
ncbi:MAG TPA: hypothetical protein VG897_11330, partial [Terriglobales bacterium]|nr:hypothetical protein [Terriglobales bacterium]